MHTLLINIIIAAALLASGPWAACASAGDVPRGPYVDGEVLVQYRESKASMRSLHYRTAWRLSHTRVFGKSGIRKVNLPTGMTVTQAVSLFRSDPDVLYVEPNYRYRIQATPNDPRFDRLWGLHNAGQSINGTPGTPYADVDARRAWDLETGHRNIIVAVIDSGIDLDHPDLVDNLWTNPGEIPGNGLDDDGNGYVDDVHGWDFAADDNRPFDALGHGTHVAGIVGAVGNNSRGVTGVCWQVSIMPLRFITATQYGTTADAIEAIAYADAMGADIINLSWGGTHYSQALAAAIESVDALVVCAAGNQGLDLDVTPLYPASYESDKIISVAASDADDHPAWFTNYSTRLVDIAAPGNEILSSVPVRTTLFADDFTDADNWMFGGTGSQWTMEDAPDGKRVLSQSAHGTNYGLDADTWAAVSDPLDLTDRAAVRLDFQITGIGADSGDRLSVEASTDQVDWIRLRIGLEDEGTTDAISGSLAAWQWATVDLGAFDDMTAVHLRFRFTSDAKGTAAGYSIADLSISGSGTTAASDAYAYYQGTSMSAAYVAGVAALVLARKPSLSVAELRLIMETSVDRKPQLTDYVASAGRINACRALESVANVDLQTQALTSDRISLDWAGHQADASGFEIRRRTGSDGDFTTIAIAGPDAGAYIDSGLSAGTTYIYRILTQSGGTRTGYSNEAAATTFGIDNTDGAGSSGSGGCFITVMNSGSPASPLE